MVVMLGGLSMEDGEGTVGEPRMEPCIIGVEEWMDEDKSFVSIWLKLGPRLLLIALPLLLVLLWLLLLLLSVLLVVIIAPPIAVILFGVLEVGEPASVDVLPMIGAMFSNASS